MKRISFTSRCKDNLLHIETDLGIINIRIGLSDRKGRKVESITFLPDDRYQGEPIVRTIPGVKGIRFVQLKKKARF